MRACQDQLFLTVCAVQKRWWHATPNVIWPYVLSKRDDCMPSPMSSDCVCFPSAMIACHARRHPTVCAAQGRWWNVTPDVIQSYVLSKGDDNMPRPTSSGRVYCLRAMMTCHTLRHLTIFVVQQWWCHSSSYVVHQCVLSKGNDSMKRPTLSDHVCCPRTRWNAIPNVVQPSVLFKVNDGI